MATRGLKAANGSHSEDRSSKVTQGLMTDRTVHEERDLKFLEDSTKTKPDDGDRKTGIAGERPADLKAEQRERKG